MFRKFGRHTLVCLLSVAFCVVALSATFAQADVTVRVAAGKFDRTNTPVRVELPKDSGLSGSVLLSGPEGMKLVGQVTGPGLLSRGERHELHFVLPQLPAGESLQLTAGKPAKSPANVFKWSASNGKFSELVFAGRPVLRYMHEPLDESRREETYKVFHHVYNPAGDAIVTKGPGGRYTHHRGVFYGFNRISYKLGDKPVSADIWHCRNAHQSHVSEVSQDVGPVLGRHRVRIAWHGAEKKVFATELREMTVYNVAGGRLIEFASRLESNSGKVKLDGDPQHAGFQFRASNEVAAKTAKQTYYLRPNGPGKPGETINWSPKSRRHVNLPWNAMSFVVGEQRYTCCYLDRPQNPKEARFSERDYGRFGSYFEFELDEGKPLELNYRLWLQEGETTVAAAEGRSRAFVNRPSATVK